MKLLSNLAILAVAVTAFSAHANTKETPSATKYGEHVALQSACKSVEGVSLKEVDKKEALKQHIAEGGKKADFKKVVSNYSKATEKNLSELDKYDLEKVCKEHAGV